MNIGEKRPESGDTAHDKTLETPAPGAVTVLLLAWSDGDESALDRLLPLVEAELRRLARGYMGRERRGHELRGAVVHWLLCARRARALW